MPRLLTRISTSGNCAVSAAQPSAPPRSTAAACTSASGAACRTLAAASVTAAFSRPLTMTSAPICASPTAEASPMPRVEPVTSAVLPVRSRSMRYPRIDFFLWLILQLFGRRHDEDVPRRRGTSDAEREAWRGDHHALGVGGMELHPRFAFFQLPVAGFADADESGTFGLFKRGQT